MISIGLKKMVETKKTTVEREAQRQRMIKLNSDPVFVKKRIDGVKKSILHKEINRQKMIKYNKSDAHRAIAKKNMAIIGKKYGRIGITKARFLQPTESQKMLNKALNEIGIITKMERYVPKIRRLIDIAVPKTRLAIEVDGSSHTPQRKPDDDLKDEQLKSLGWKVLRFTNKEVNDDLNRVIQTISKGYYITNNRRESTT